MCPTRLTAPPTTYYPTPLGGTLIYSDYLPEYLLYIKINNTKEV